MTVSVKNRSEEPPDRQARLIQAVLDVLESARPETEKEFQLALARELDALCELRAMFAPADYTPPMPTSADTALLKPGRKVGDVCDGYRRSVDLLWDSECPIELKLVTSATRSSDVVGYGVLRDFHRMERLIEVSKDGKNFPVAQERFVIFATDHPGYWLNPWEWDGPSEPEPFSLAEGRSLQSPYWVCYPQRSPNTRWADYRPFFLANWYDDLTWHNAKHGWRVLIQRVHPQVGLRPQEAQDE